MKKFHYLRTKWNNHFGQKIFKSISIRPFQRYKVIRSNNYQFQPKPRFLSRQNLTFLYEGFLVNSQKSKLLSLKIQISKSAVRILSKLSGIILGLFLLHNLLWLMTTLRLQYMLVKKSLMDFFSC
jgi:hypothetical protein